MFEISRDSSTWILSHATRWVCVYAIASLFNFLLHPAATHIKIDVIFQENCHSLEPFQHFLRAPNGNSHSERLYSAELRCSFVHSLNAGMAAFNLCHNSFPVVPFSNEQCRNTQKSMRIAIPFDPTPCAAHFGTAVWHTKRQLLITWIISIFVVIEFVFKKNRKRKKLFFCWFPLKKKKRENHPRGNVERFSKEQPHSLDVPKYFVFVFGLLRTQ